MARKNLAFGAHQVILFDATDRLEQLRTQFIIEIFWEQVFRLCRESPPDVFGEFRVPVSTHQVVNKESWGVRGFGLHLPESLSSLTSGENEQWGRALCFLAVAGLYAAPAIRESAAAAVVSKPRA